MGIFNIFGKKGKKENEFDRLNALCDSAFKEVFSRCRFDFGREMVGLMDLKSALKGKVGTGKDIAPAQELLAKKMLELFIVYFKTCDTYVSLKKGGAQDESTEKVLEEMKDRIDSIYSLINKLNSQFYLCSGEVTGMSGKDEVVNEAEALLNAVKDMYNF